MMILKPDDRQLLIGFTDLTMLLFGDTSGLENGGIVNVYGVDSSPISVARTLIIKQMLMGAANLNSIFQVWYMSCLTD